MEGHCSTGQSPQWAVAPMEEEEEEYMCTHKYIYIYMYVCLFVCIMYVCMYVRTYVCLCVCVCMYKCMDAIINVYAYLCVYERMFSSLLVFSTSLIMPLPLHLCTHIPSASILVSRNFFP